MVPVNLVDAGLSQTFNIYICIYIYILVSVKHNKAKCSKTRSACIDILTWKDVHKIMFSFKSIFKNKQCMQYDHI